MKDLNTENYNALKKESEEALRKWRTWGKMAEEGAEKEPPWEVNSRHWDIVIWGEGLRQGPGTQEGSDVRTRAQGESEERLQQRRRLRQAVLSSWDQTHCMGGAAWTSDALWPSATTGGQEATKRSTSLEEISGHSGLDDWWVIRFRRPPRESDQRETSWRGTKWTQNSEQFLAPFRES